MKTTVDRRHYVAIPLVFEASCTIWVKIRHLESSGYFPSLTSDSQCFMCLAAIHYGTLERLSQTRIMAHSTFDLSGIC